ncbi:conserved hypothetical protein [Deferribacter desulfuricans SSM1]|uniref:Peptidase C14 caspase domain-containing protein n=1 Tax=Deferribacter desulfuricans (strain DSM 14783 / JCM 11476 / NBRC 101012 / SSM1) TaxID=639282 RepID=D3PCQ4_DEFDS|nr:caspase family protein [Deferribacter desulfuricans]BAI80377.1 conserved hypothetical protein [Deferribacter desulfuricans SSM1]
MRIVIIIFLLSGLTVNLYAIEKPEVFVQLGHSAPITYLNFSYDGRYIISAADMDFSLKVWNVQSEKLIQTIKNINGVKAATLSNDGKILIVSNYEGISLYDLSTGKKVKTIKLNKNIRPNKISVYPGTNTILLAEFIDEMMNNNFGPLYNYNSFLDISSLDIRESKIIYYKYDNLQNIAVSNDGRFAVFINRENEPWLFELIEATTGNSIWKKSFFDRKQKYETPFYIIISSDNSYLIIQTNLNIYVVNLFSGRIIQKYSIKKIGADKKIIASNGKFILMGNEKHQSLSLVEIKSGAKINEMVLNDKIISVSPDMKYFITSSGTIYRTFSLEKVIKLQDVQLTTAAFWEDYLLTGDKKGDISLIDITLKRQVKKYRSLHLMPYALSKKFNNYLIAVYRLEDEKWKFLVWDLKNAKQLTKIKDFKKFAPKESFDEEGNLLITRGYGESVTGKYEAQKTFNGYIKLIDIKTKKIIAQFLSFVDGEWIVITPEGYYNASPNGDKYLNVRIGNKVYGIENYREAFYRPDLVRLALSGKSLEGYKTLADAGTPPDVEIIDTPSKTDKDEITVTLKITDTGGGIGDIRLYLNDTAVIVDSARGIKITPKAGEKTIFKTYTVKLLNGENIIKAVAFNGDNTMQSNPAIHTVLASISIKKPSIYAVVIGINEYKNPKLTLKYAVADANLFAETISQVAKPLFEKVEVKLLTTKEKTTKEYIKKTLKSYKHLNPDDVFVFYVASHGTVDDGEYFLITSNVGSLSTFRLKKDALTQTELKELIANVPSTKKMIVIDTCNAGKLGEALQMAILTRGMSEETAVKILSKAVGSTIISASTSLQEALEGYQGHGLFTYVLAEGLKGKADLDKDGFIKTLELATYVDSEVPTLADKIFKRSQYPVASPTGQSFPLGKVK